MRSTSQRRGLGRSVALLVISAALVACGKPTYTPAGTETGPAAGTTGAVTSSSGSTPPPSTSSAPPSTTKAEPESLAWVPFGPTDPTVPTPTWPLYRALAAGKCSELRAALGDNDAGDFGRAMAALCAAAVERDQSQWTVLEALSDADPSLLANTCVSPLVSDLIKRALEWRERHPGLSPRIAFRTVPGTTKCGHEALQSQGGGDPTTSDPGTTTETTTEPTTETATDTPTGQSSVAESSGAAD